MFQLYVKFFNSSRRRCRYLKMYFPLLNKAQVTWFIVLCCSIVVFSGGRGYVVFARLRDVYFKVSWQPFIVFISLSSSLIIIYFCLSVLSGSGFPSNALVPPYSKEAGLLEFVWRVEGTEEHSCRASVWLLGFWFWFFAFHLVLGHGYK